MTPKSVQNGVPVSALITQAAAMLPTFVIPDLIPARPSCSLGSCELSSHITYLSQCGVCRANL